MSWHLGDPCGRASSGLDTNRAINTPAPLLPCLLPQTRPFVCEHILYMCQLLDSLVLERDCKLARDTL